MILFPHPLCKGRGCNICGSGVMRGDPNDQRTWEPVVRPELRKGGKRNEYC
jgi:hypothetical protein